MRPVLIDAGPVVAYYSADDDWHEQAAAYFSGFRGQFVTTEAIVTEVMWQLQPDHRVQNEFLNDIAVGLYRVEALLPQEYRRIQELNLKYRDRPADFADLSLIVVSERLKIADIASLDSDFSVYRRYRKVAFNQVFPKH